MKEGLRYVILWLSVLFIYPNLLIGPVITVAFIAALLHRAVGH